jgi:hypothetical protein
MQGARAEPSDRRRRARDDGDDGDDGDDAAAAAAPRTGGPSPSFR